MSDFSVTTESFGTALPIHSVTSKNYSTWRKRQPAATQRWLETNRFEAKANNFCLLPDKDGNISGVACGVGDISDIWSLAHLPMALPPGTYRLEGGLTPAQATQMTLGWALAGYRFSRYKEPSKSPATLIAPKGCDLDYVFAMAKAIHWARDLINTPAGDMHPAALAQEALDFAKQYEGKATVIQGEELLAANYPTVYAVGKAAAVPPHLVDIRFPRKGAPKVTLVGKGVCFDSGGLDIKSSSNMKLMKKDMGGAAAVLALARVIVEMKLPVQLRVILPIVENAVAGNAMRPLDIVKTRKGLTVEIGNTDAEGRLILCDALTEADGEKPDLLIDCATLTGAARVALGTDIPAFFTPDDALAAAAATHSAAESDPLWRLPLWKPYRSLLDTSAADISNDPDSGYGGAITAALYLQEFVSDTPSWMHIDMMAWNLKDRPGRPQGGEAMAVRALFALVREKYGKG